MRHGTWVDLPQDAPETMAMAGERRNLYFMGIGSNAFSVGFALWSRSRQCMAQWLGCQGCGSHG